MGCAAIGLRLKVSFELEIRNKKCEMVVQRIKIRSAAG